MTQISEKNIELSYSKGNAAVADLDLGAKPNLGASESSNHVLTLGPQWKTQSEKNMKKMVLMGKPMENP